jgi:ubiquinone/menaquinone biosynthesis C-methylase UbiE
VLVEPDRWMLRRLRARAAAARPDADVVQASAERLPFPDDCFDTAVVTFVLCTVPDPVTALAEIKRLLRPGGPLLLAEHVRSDDPRLARRQDRQRRFYNLVVAGCNPNRDTLTTVHTAGFTTDEIRPGEIPNAPPVERPLIIGAARSID